MDETNTDVLIVGAGPTGLVLALYLAKFGIRLRILDKSSEPGQTSRAIGVQARTLEFYDTLNLAEKIINAGMEMKFLELKKNGAEVGKINIHNIGENLSPFPYILSLPQDDHEKILIEELAKFNISIERDTEWLSFDKTGNGILNLVKKNNTEEKIWSKYLCACDGAKSSVRHKLNLDFAGGTSQQKFYVADVESDTNVDEVQINISKKDFCLVFPVRSTGNVRLIGIVPEAVADKTQLTFADVESSVFENARLTIGKVNWFSTYHVHHRLINHFSVGQVFLLGDAAHIHSPVGAQGMNTGIGDAVNLAWKLQQVINNTASEAMLATYHTERYAFAKKLVKTTDLAFKLVSSQGVLGMVWRDLLVPHIFPFIFSYQFCRKFFFRFISQIHINYRQSELSSGNAGKLNAGDRLPWLGENYLPLKELCWQIHCYGNINPAQKAAIDKLEFPVFTFPWENSAKIAGIAENHLYLLRPDGYISAIDKADDLPNIQKILQRFDIKV